MAAFHCEDCVNNDCGNCVINEDNKLILDTDEYLEYYSDDDD